MVGSDAAGQELGVCEAPDDWIDQDVDPQAFRDVRLGRRLRTLLGQLSHAPGQGISLVCQDWANTKAAYRFLSNERVDEGDILTGHLTATRQCSAAIDDSVLLVLHDTTEFSWHRPSAQAIGALGTTSSSRDAEGRMRQHTVRGMLMHSSLVVTREGLPLGLAAVRFWTRDRFKGANALKRSINPTGVPIEAKESRRWLDNVRQASALLAPPERCVHIGDRGSDIYELFCESLDVGAHFIYRTCADRLAHDGSLTLAMHMQRARCRGVHVVEVRDSLGKRRTARLALKYCRARVLPPRAKQSRYRALTLTAVHATEQDAPADVAPIDWKLLTDLPVTCRAQAIEKLQWYAMRWKIETFHKILKSGWRAEASRLRTTQRLTNLIAMLCIVGWRIFWLTMISRVAPNGSAALAFTTLEVQLLDRLRPAAAAEEVNSRSPLSSRLMQLAQLGGYLARASDPPPGPTVFWRVMARLTDIQIGFVLGLQTCG